MKFRYIILIIIVLVFVFFLNAPTTFPVDGVVRIGEGATLRSVSLELKNKNIIRSRIIFEAFMIMYGGEKHIIYSDYLFEKKLSVFDVAYRINKGRHNMKPISVTIPEGFNNIQIANTFSLKLSNFNKDNFLNKANNLEGYLFPDTYLFSSIDDEDNVIKSMNNNFNNKMKKYFPEIKRGSREESDLIVMASLVEGEANGDVDREFIAGILWKRLSINMPLQVDVAPITYKKRGLPDKPIGNPGILSIKATLYPKKSSYLYYLHDKNGNIYYAKTFTEHQRNIKKYLN
jgi:UPF0755 protein